MNDTNDVIGRDVIPMPVLIYGRSACEETALVRDRLDRLGISFVEVDIDQAEEAARFVKGLNNGAARTPILVFGDQDMILAAPSVAQLDQALRRAGYEVGR